MSYAGTDKQKSICKLILAHARDHAGASIWFGDLFSLLTWKASPQALQCSLRVLEKYGFVVRSYGEGRRLYLAGTKKMSDFYGD